MYNWLDRLKAWVLEIVKSRAFVLILVFCLMSGILVQRLFVLQIVKGQEYLDDYKLQIQKTKIIQGTRGRILDRNGVVLADNKLAYSVTIEDNGDYGTLKEKNGIINETLSRVIEIVESNGDTIINNFKIILNDNGDYEYTMDEGPQRLRFLADVFGEAKIEKLTEKQKNLEAAEVIDYLCTDEQYGYGLDQDVLSKAEILKMVNIRYAMSLNRFQKYMATTIASDVSEETTAAVMENIDTLQGVNIAEDSLREYPNGKYFASLLGYTGQISQAEYDALNEKQKKNYSLTDIVGKAGLEQVLDESLQGPKGESKIYVNSVGKILEITEGKKPGAGNDNWLSIDANLQMAAYDLLEEKLAGILLAKIQNVSDYDRSGQKEGNESIIPIDDVYFACIDNEILDSGHFEEADAGTAEQAVYQAFAARREEVLHSVDSQLSNPDAAEYKATSREMQAYLSYICATLLTTNSKILLSDKIDREDAMYRAWEEAENISLYTYLNYAISKNWVDTSKLKNYMDDDGSYSNSDEVYQGLVKYIGERLSKDTEFEKLIYKYMIKNRVITGTQICLMLYEQDVLEYDEKQYHSLASGMTAPYDFIRGKIETLELTPGQLGLEPCTGSVVVTDTNTGKVLALVSYPGYDNNRLANSMDSAYYSRLVHDGNASPLYNNATQERTAPGSTYKPLVAAAALTEGVTNLGEHLTCTGVYTKTTPEAKCWIYPGSHGSLNVSGAITQSCNNFFYEMGFRLGLTPEAMGGLDRADRTGETTAGKRSEKQALAKLEQYAMLFGLGQATGIEIPESEPQISDKDAVRSAIGQGTNNYTTTQLARYITAVANKGTVFNLSLLEKQTDLKGNVKKEYETKVLNQIENISGSTWDAVHKGMRNVVAESSTYQSLGDFKMSGKTGTAQQSKSHANHALFVGYAPSDAPEVAFAIRIKNGYESLYVSEVGRDLMRYYYGLADRSELIQGRASEVKTVNVHGD